MNRRTLDWHSLDETVADARALHEQGYTPQGNWDLTQVLGHLRIMVDASMDGFPIRLPRIVPWLMQVTGQKKKILTTRRFPKSLPVSKKLKRETPARDRDEEARAVEAYAAAVERFKQHTGPTVQSPAFGPLDHAQWAEVHIIHGMHHLSFLQPKSE